MLTTQVTQLKINNNPYARAFRDTLPSSGGRKSGGHYRQSSHKGTSHKGSKSNHSRSSTPSPRLRVKPQHKQKKVNCNSAASMESGKRLVCGAK